MTQEQFNGLKPGDTVWIRGTVAHRSSAHRTKFDEDQILHEVELELPRPSAPEGNRTVAP